MKKQLNSKLRLNVDEVCKRHIAQLINKITAGLLCFFLISVSFCPITAMADETEQKTVRVGYHCHDSKCFHGRYSGGS